MEEFVRLRGDSCKAYWILCSLLAPARTAYTRIAEASLSLDPRKELEAASLSTRFQEPSATCSFAQWALNIYGDREACILGPLAPVGTRCNGHVFSVEQGVTSTSRIDVLTGDLDAVLSIRAPPSTARFWLVHLHGDNTALGMLMSDQLHGEIVFTNQKFCLWPVLGIGGFTDGDRLIALAMSLGIETIRLIGYDFNNAQCIGKKACDLAAKRVKLSIARRIVELLAKTYSYKLSTNSEEYILSKD